MQQKIGVAPIFPIRLPHNTAKNAMSPEVIKIHAAIVRAEAAGFTHLAKSFRAMLAKELGNHDAPQT